MQLTRFTDFSLRVLMSLAAKPDELATVAALAQEYGISRHHLTRVVHQLGVKGYIDTMRGKGGGFRLAREPEEICIGDVVRDMESGFEIAECFQPGQSSCRLMPGCTLKGILAEAAQAFLAALDGYSLADLLPPPGQKVTPAARSARRG